MSRLRTVSADSTVPVLPLMDAAMAFPCRVVGMWVSGFSFSSNQMPL